MLQERIVWKKQLYVTIFSDIQRFRILSRVNFENGKNWIYLKNELHFDFYKDI